MTLRNSFGVALASITLLHSLRLLAEPMDETQFRLISEADFLGSRPPPEVARHPAGLNAVSCLRIAWPAGFRIDFSPLGAGGVSATATPRFVALFDRKCSWWSSKPEDPTYALLHEQVHFAIAEHAARMLTQEMRAKGQVVRGRGTTRADALADLDQNLRRFAFRAKHAARREHDAFDSETRRDRSEFVQQKWVDVYEKRLGMKLSRAAN